MHNTAVPTRTTCSRRPALRGARGFSLMEVLIALGIFAVGLVAVAAVFPTAIAVQRETVRDLAGQRAVVNAQSMVQALVRLDDPKETDPPRNFRELTYHHDTNPVNRKGTLKDFTLLTAQLPSHASTRTGFPGGVQPMLDQPLPPTSPINRQLQFPAFAEMNKNSIALNAAKSFHALFSEDVRSYPQSIPQTDRRDYYWFPLIQTSDLSRPVPSWRMYLMVMQRRGTEAVPEVRAALITSAIAGRRVIEFATSGGNGWDNDADDDGIYDLLQPGDWVLTDDGSVHHVVVAERDKITVESPIPVGKPINLIYFAVAIDRITGDVKREGRSPIVRIEQFELAVSQP